MAGCEYVAHDGVHPSVSRCIKEESGINSESTSSFGPSLTSIVIPVLTLFNVILLGCCLLNSTTSFGDSAMEIVPWGLFVIIFISYRLISIDYGYEPLICACI
jgi:hypothetical protein